MFFFKTFINETLADDKLKLLGYEALGVRQVLMCFIAKSPVNDYLYRTVTEPYTDEEIAILVTLELQKWLQIKERLIKYGGFSVNNQKAIGISKFSEKYQSDYYRQKKYRVTKKVTPEVTKQLQTDIRSQKLEVRSIEEKKELNTHSGQAAGDVVDSSKLQEQKPYEITTDLQRIICAYKVAKGFAYDDRQWDKAHFRTWTPAAKKLLEILGTDDSAIACIEHYQKKFDGKNLDWTLAAVARWSSEWKMKEGVKYASSSGNCGASNERFAEEKTGLPKTEISP